MLATVLSLTSASVANAASLGIDVSKYQGAINWGAVPSSGVTYAFIRVGTTKGPDPAFAANVAGAQAAGIRTGVYIYSYAGSVEGAIADAQLVLQWIEGYNINFPVVFDVEDKIQAGLDANTVTAMCNAFCDVIASAGYYPMIYTGTYFYRKHITPALRYDAWVAHYGVQACGIPTAAIWLASCTGRIAGIAGNVDIDYMYKDYNSIILPLGFTQRGGYTYLYNNYRLQFGWVDFAGLRYHMDALGRMNTGWFSDETGTYYLAADGHALVGPNQIDQDRFYFDALGRIQSGWVTIADNQYYYNPANGGRMLTGWFGDEKGMHYLFPADGHLVKGLATIDNKNYLFSAEGNMLVGWQNIGGLNFFFNPADGAMFKGLIPGADGIYGTSQTDGHQLKNEAAVIDKVLRCFDANGRLVVNAPYAIGAAVYVCDANGVAALATPPAPAAPAAIR